MAFKSYNLWIVGCWGNCVRSELGTIESMKTWSVSRHYHRICMEGIMNTMKGLEEAIRYPNQLNEPTLIKSDAKSP